MLADPWVTAVVLTHDRPWVLRERRPVPPHVESWMRLLDEPRRRSRARRYVG